MTAVPNRQVLLRRRPTGLVAPGDTELVTAAAPRPPRARRWSAPPTSGSTPPPAPGSTASPATCPRSNRRRHPGCRVGEVVASRCDAYAVGDVVTTLAGFQEYVIIRDDVFTTPAPAIRPAADHVCLRGTGATAYFGMTDIGTPAPGETVVVSAAAGADRLAGGADRQDRRRQGGRYRGRAAQVQARWSTTSGSTRASTTGRRPAGSSRALPAAGERLLRQRRRTRSSTPCLGGWRTGQGRALRGHLQLPDGEHPDPPTTSTCSPRPRHAGVQRPRQWDRFPEAFAALREWEARGRLVHRRPSSRASSPASTPSTAC